MKINDSSLKEILIKAKNQSDVVTDLKAQELIEGALEKLDKKTNVKRVIFNLKQDINMYAVTHVCVPALTHMNRLIHYQIYT